MPNKPYFSTPYQFTPYAIALIQPCKPQELRDFLVQLNRWEEPLMSRIYRYLQEWRTRGWIERESSTNKWYAFPPNIEYYRREILYHGWPNWLAEAGYTPTMIKAIDIDEVVKDKNTTVTKVDPSIWDQEKPVD